MGKQKKRWGGAMKRVFFLLVLLLVCGKNIFAVEINGDNWNNYPPEWKLGFVQGWMEGGSYNTGEFAQEVILNATKENTKELPKLVNIFYKKSGLNLLKTTFRKIINEIDILYLDPRLKKWGFSEIMPLVRGRVEGKLTEKDIDEVIAYHQKNILFWETNLKKNKWNRKEWEKIESQKPNALKALEEE
jgi:hypothetical protein